MSVVYRGYKIEQHWVSRTSEKQDEFVYSHEDYDGPGDRRCGHAVGLRNCLDEIDWIEDEIEGVESATSGRQDGKSFSSQ